MQRLNAIISQNIVDCLKQKKIKQSDLAEATGLSIQSVQKILNCSRNLSFIEMKKIADFLGITVSDLLKPRYAGGKEITQNMLDNLNSPIVKEVFRSVDTIAGMIDFHVRLERNAYKMWQPVTDI